MEQLCPVHVLMPVTHHASLLVSCGSSILDGRVPEQHNVCRSGHKAIACLEHALCLPSSCPESGEDLARLDSCLFHFTKSGLDLVIHVSIDRIPSVTAPLP